MDFKISMILCYHENTSQVRLETLIKKIFFNELKFFFASQACLDFFIFMTCRECLQMALIKLNFYYLNKNESFSNL